MSEKKITKADIVDRVYSKSDVNRKDIHIIVDLVLEEIKDSLASCCGVELRGFGSFSHKVRKGRTKARNPKTGESLSVAPHGVIVFKPGKDLKKAVWDNVDIDS